MSLQTLILTVWLSIACYSSLSQCTPNTIEYPSGSSFVPTNSYSSPTTCNYSGEYYTVQVTLGQDYEFSTCSSDGSSASYDTQLMLTDGNQNILAFNDDYCGTQSYIIWTANYTGVAQLHLFEFACASNTTCTSVLCKVTSNAPCVTSYPYTNNFETSIEWNATGPSSSSSWLRNSGPTTSSSTGPDNAVVFGNDPISNCANCYYAYCETSGAGSNGTFELESGCFDFSSLTTPRLEFDYHAFGSTIGNISVEVSTDQALWTSIWSSSGGVQTNGAELATTVEIDLTNYSGLSTVFLKFKYVAGGSYTGDIAIDDIQIDNQQVVTICNTSYPYELNFESGIIWNNKSTTGDLWTTNTGSTTSSDTGPIDASVFGNDPASNCQLCTYLYAETSGSSGSGTFILESPCFDFSNLISPSLNFDLHAFGGTVGTIEVQYSIDGINWTSVWSLTGQQQFSSADQAVTEFVDIGFLSGETEVYLRFHYQAGGSFTGDIALDDIYILETPGNPTNVWLGNDDNWFDSNNWLYGVPDSNSNVIIGITANNPSTSEGKVKDITIESGAELTITGELSVFGNYSNYGQTNMRNTNGSLIFRESNNKSSITGGIQELNNIILRNPMGVEFLSGEYLIYGALKALKGTIETNDNLIIASDQQNTGRITEIGGNCQITLDMQDSYGDGWNGGFLSVIDDGEVIGQFLANGFGSTVTVNIPNNSDISIQYTSGSWESENSYSILDSDGNLIFSDGPTPQTGVVFSFSSSCPLQNPFIGDVIVQQYLDLSNNGWRDITSSLQDKTLIDWNNDGLIMTNFPGSNWPNFGWTSVYTYNESNCNGNKDDGWVAATNINDTLNYKSAHRVYIGNGSLTLDLKGVINYDMINIPFSCDNILPQEASANVDQKGWNLLGNPYPCPINWDLIDENSKTGIENKIWVWNSEAGNYGVYTGNSGQGTNNVNGNISAHQGFWIHANAPGNLVINESDKIDEDVVLVKSIQSRPFLKVSLINDQNTMKDEIIILSNAQASSEYDLNWDALKLYSPDLNAPSLSISTSFNDLSINHFNSLLSYTTVLKYSPNHNGPHKLNFTGTIEEFGDGCFFLEDKITGNEIAINDSTEYLFNPTLSPQDNNRFILHWVIPLHHYINDVTCNSKSDGEIIIENPNETPVVFGFHDSVMSHQIFNGVPFHITNLESGHYNTYQSSSTACPVLNYELIIEEPSTLELLWWQTNDLEFSQCQGHIKMDSKGGTPPYQFSLNGDINQQHDYLCESNYELTVRDSNQCLTTETIDILTSQISGLDQSVNITPSISNGIFFINSNQKNPLELKVYDVSGKLIFNQVNQPNNYINLVNEESGIYFIHLNSNRTNKIIKVMIHR